MVGVILTHPGLFGMAVHLRRVFTVKTYVYELNSPFLGFVIYSHEAEFSR